MKTTVYAAYEAAKILDKFNNLILPGSLAMKIYDNHDVLRKKAEFLEKETAKIIESAGATAENNNDPNARMVVRSKDGSVDEVATKRFVDQVVELRNTEVDLDLQPFSTSELDRIDFTPLDYARIKFMTE